MKHTSTGRKGSKGPSRTESPYTAAQRMLMRGLYAAGFSQGQVATLLGGRVTATAVGTAVREGGNSRHIPESEIKINSDKVGKPRGQLA